MGGDQEGKERREELGSAQCMCACTQALNGRRCEGWTWHMIKAEGKGGPAGL